MADTEPLEISEIFDLAFRFVTETNENIFLTGKAGTGKTTFLKYLKENCSKNIVVAAPTGVAAINAGGVTLHSLFQLPFHPFLPTPAGKNELLERLRFTAKRIDLIRKLDLLVIDEISMVRSDTMDAIDTILRHIRRKHDLPFGGVQLLFIGDLYQLPPVAPRQDWMVLHEYYNSEFFFDSKVIGETMPVLIELKKIYRQKNDDFISLLNKVRNNEMDANDFDELHLRYRPGFIPPEDDKYITLTSHNSQADRINATELSRINEKSFIFKAETEGDFPESMFPAEESLELKVGAQVMFLKNDVEKKYFNGKIGIIQSLDDEEIVVESEGQRIYVNPETWENTRYTINREDGKLEQELLGTFTQFPLRLAWAITIHKSQGLTFDKVMIDAGAAFSSGQVYVALSRCKSLDGIVLLSKISPSAVLCNSSVVRYQQSMAPRGSLAERFDGARLVYTLQLFDEIFSFSDIARYLYALGESIKENYEKINKESFTWWQQLNEDFLKEQEIGQRFSTYTQTLLQKEPIAEKNSELQKRVSDAAHYFSKKIISFKDSVMEHPVITEHREVSREIDPQLNDLLHSLLLEIYSLEYCKDPFSVTGYLKHKLKYILPKTTVTSYAGKKKQTVSDIPNVELFLALRAWRDETCDQYDLPIYMVANQNSLKEIATYLPLTKKDLMKVKGFGKAKADRYGDDILDLVIDYCSKNNIDAKAAPLFPESPKKEKEKKKEQKVPSSEISFELFKAGKTIEEIAKERNMVPTTIEGHLATFVTKGELDINEIVPAEVQEKIRKAAETHGWESLKTLKGNLDNDISFGQIRLTKAVMQKN